MFKSIIIGNLGADAVLQTANGKEFLSFKIAVNDRYTDANGVAHESVTWVSCAYNGRHDRLQPFLKAGQTVAVIGDVRLRTYHSEKQRALVAGANCAVQSVELIGSAAPAVPRALFDSGGAQHNVQAWFLTDAKCSNLFDQSGRRQFKTDNDGWVYPVVDSPTDGNFASEGKAPGDNGDSFKPGDSVVDAKDVVY